MNIKHYIPNTIGEVDDYISLLRGKVHMVTFDTERVIDHTLLHKSRVVLLQMAIYDEDSQIVHVGLIHFRLIDTVYRKDLMTISLSKILNSNTIIKVGVDAHTDAMYIRETFPHICMAGVIDLQDITYALGYGRLSASDMCKKIIKKGYKTFSIDGSKMAPPLHGNSTWATSIDVASYKYASNDVLIVLDIWNNLYHSAEKDGNPIVDDTDRIVKQLDMFHTDNPEKNYIDMPIVVKTHKSIPISASDVKQVENHLRKTCRVQNITKIDSAINVIVNGYAPWSMLDKDIRHRMASDVVSKLKASGIIYSGNTGDGFKFL